MSQEIERDQIMQLIVGYVQKDPEFAPRIVDACSHGIGLALRREAEKSSDLECALVAVTVNRQNAWAIETVLQKLEKWNGHLSVRWDDFIAQMKKRKAA